MAVRINLVKGQTALDFRTSSIWGVEGARRTRERCWRRHWRKKNRKKVLEKARNWRAKNREKTRAYAKKFRIRHPEKVRASHKRYLARYPEKEAKRRREHYLRNRKKILEQNKRWLKKNAAAWNAYNTSRRRRYKKQQPGWVSAAQLKQHFLQDVKLSADHIYPLQGKWVSGFHAPANIRFIPQSANSRKSNKFAPALHLNQPLPAKLWGYPAVSCLTLDIAFIRQVYKGSFYAE